MRFLETKNDRVYLECTECKRVLKFKEYQLKEIENGIECFCGNISDSIENAANMESLLDIKADGKRKQKMLVKCPISVTSKVVGGAMFGIFSSNVRNTFKCEQCGYKW